MRHVTDSVGRVMRWMIVLPLDREFDDPSVAEREIQEFLLNACDRLYEQWRRFLTLSLRVERGITQGKNGTRNQPRACLKLTVTGFSVGLLREVGRREVLNDLLSGDLFAYREHEFQPIQLTEVNEIAADLIAEYSPHRGWCDVIYSHKTWRVKLTPGVQAPLPFVV